MVAYVITNIVEITDPDQFEQYRDRALATHELYGGRLLAGTSITKVLEGEWDSHRTIIIEFPNRQSALKWYNSEEYKPLAEVRNRAARSNMVLVDG